MLHEALIPFLAGLLVGVNPYSAPLLRARLLERARSPRHVPLESALVTCGIALFLVAFAWRYAGFISGRLTNSLLLLGIFALAGAFYSLRPLRRREPEPAPTGWRWLTRHASDLAYYAGPAWIVATAIAMKQLTLIRFATPYVAAAAGIVLATLAWTTRYAHALPDKPHAPGENRPRALLVLSFAYGASAVLMFAGNLKLL